MADMATDILSVAEAGECEDSRLESRLSGENESEVETAEIEKCRATVEVGNVEDQSQTDREAVGEENVALEMPDTGPDLFDSEEKDMERPSIQTEDTISTQSQNRKANKYTSKLGKSSQFPLARVKTIMKTDPEVALVNQDAVFLISKATEMFVREAAKEAYRFCQQAKKKTVQRRDLENVLDQIDEYAFLEGVFEP